MGSVVEHVRFHTMRAYYLPLAAGLILAGSAFMPWTMIGDLAVGGLPSIPGFWVLGLAMASVVLAGLSVITRKNSRHPLLVVGLAAFAIVLVSERWMERAAADRIWAREQARAIVQGDTESVPLPDPTLAPGGYVALGAAAVIAAFGLTIVVKRVPSPYAVPQDDDV